MMTLLKPVNSYNSMQILLIVANYQKWGIGHKARGQGQGQKKFRGQDQEQTLSRPSQGPRTQPQVCSK